MQAPNMRCSRRGSCSTQSSTLPPSVHLAHTAHIDRNHHQRHQRDLQQGVSHRLPAPQAASSATVTTTAPPAQSEGSTWISKEARQAMFSQATEYIEPVEGAVTGNLPPWLEGDLVGNGGGYYQGMVHLFDGLAMLTKVSLRDGKVTTSQRFLHSRQWKHVESTGKLRWREFVTQLPMESALDKAKNLLGNMMVMVTDKDATTDNASVSVTPLPDGTVLALSETKDSQYRVNPRDLSTLEQIKQQDGVPSQLQTAHPKLLPCGKKLVNLTRSLPLGGYHVVIQDLETLERKQIAFFRDTNPLSPAWVHDFSITQDHVIIVENPFLINVPSMMIGGETEYLTLDWVPQQMTRVHIVKLDGTGARSFVAPSFFTFHHANAFEDQDNIYVDMAAYTGPNVMLTLSMSAVTAYPGKQMDDAYLWRLTIPKSAPAGSRLNMPVSLARDPQDHGVFCEFPAINNSYRGKEYRYVYSLAAKRPTHLGNALAKFDLQTGQVLRWHESGCAPGEPVFVPAPDSQSEDDGVVLSGVMGSDGRSFLLVLDAQSFTEVARAQLPHGLPYRFHGAWLPAAKA